MKAGTLVWPLLVALIEFQVSAHPDTSQVMVNNDDLSASTHKFNIQQTQQQQTSSKEERDDNESRKHNDASASSQPQSQPTAQTHLKSLSISEAPTKSPQQVAAGSAGSAASLGHRQQPMSCYVCSTMDYENSSDNICRSLKHHPRLSQQPAGGHYLAERQMPQANLMPSMRDTSTSGPEASGAVSSNGTAFSAGSHSAGFFPVANHRASSSGHVRTRPCSDDENFCSIVSIVKIEFSNDNISSKFWAMERNCSRSCNTGCMIIGERVRLRVCSQCCRTQNCNIGSGVAALFSLNLERSLLLLVSSLITVREFLSSRKCISLGA